MSNQIISVLVFTVRDGFPYFWMSQRLSEGHRKDYWQFPGGKVEDGETLLVSAQRELKEETGLDIPEPRLLRLTSTNSHHPSRGPYTTHWFLLELAGTEIPQRTEPLENTEWEALTSAEVVLRVCLPGTRRAMLAARDFLTKGAFR